MSTAANIDPAGLPWIDQPEKTKPKPMTSLLASAHRITARNSSIGRIGVGESWQNDAWEMYDLVGEQRFLATTLAGRMAQARFFVGERHAAPDDDTGTDTDEENEDAETTDGQEVAGSLVPIETKNQEAQELLEYIGGGPAGFSQMIARLGINMFVAGDGYLVGIPRHLLPDESQNEAGQPPPSQNLRPTSPMPQSTPDTSVPIEDFVWRMLSTSEVSITSGNELTLSLGDVSDQPIKVNPDDVFLIRVWRPHPRKWWEADSPTRSSLPILRELVGLTMHISAQVDSRLAGAGLLLVPQSAQRALKQAAGMSEDSEEDIFTEALMDAMMTPINDRSSASAVVPLVSVVPDETTDKFRHLSFSSELDGEARELRDEAIRRLALGQDAPPELLLGTGSMNHWGAWLVREDVVTTHIEPHLALICDALTTQYLRPLLVEMGYSEDEARQYEVWYDVSHMVARPNRSSDAQRLHDQGVISNKALREANGFDDDDAPREPHLDMATDIALKLIQSQPHLVENIDALVDKLRLVVAEGIRHGKAEDEDGDPFENEQERQTAAERDADRTDAIDEVPEQEEERIVINENPELSSDSALGILQRAERIKERQKLNAR